MGAAIVVYINKQSYWPSGKRLNFLGSRPGEGGQKRGNASIFEQISSAEVILLSLMIRLQLSS